MQSADRIYEKLRRVQFLLPEAELDPIFLTKAIDAAPALDARWQDWLNREFEPLDRDEISASLLALSDQVPVISKFLKSDWSLSSNKQTYKENPLSFFNRSLVNGSLWWKQTSGTSGPPLDVIYENTFHFEQLFHTVRRVLFRIEAQSDRQYHPIVSVAALHDNSSSRDCIWPDPSDEFRCITQLYFSESDQEQNKSVLQRIARLRPETVTLKPSILERLTRLELLQQLHCSFILCSGSQLSRELKRDAAQATSAQITEAYGLTESAIFASECKMDTGMHIDGDVLAEVLGEKGYVDKDGCGRLLITSSRNVAMPLLRYETGDIVELCAKQCKCGRPTPRIRKIIGRHMRNFVLASGREVSPSNFHSIFSHFPLQEVQFVQTSPHVLLVRLQETEQIDDRQLEEFICGVLGERIQIVLERTTFPNIENKKFQRYIRDFCLPCEQ